MNVRARARARHPEIHVIRQIHGRSVSCRGDERPVHVHGVTGCLRELHRFAAEFDLIARCARGDETSSGDVYDDKN